MPISPEKQGLFDKIRAANAAEVESRIATLRGNMEETSPLGKILLEEIERLQEIGQESIIENDFQANERNRILLNASRRNIEMLSEQIAASDSSNETERELVELLKEQTKIQVKQTSRSNELLKKMGVGILEKAKNAAVSVGESALMGGLGPEVYGMLQSVFDTGKRIYTGTRDLYRERRATYGETTSPEMEMNEDTGGGYSFESKAEPEEPVSKVAPEPKKTETVVENAGLVTDPRVIIGIERIDKRMAQMHNVINNATGKLGAFLEAEEGFLSAVADNTNPSYVEKLSQEQIAAMDELASKVEMLVEGQDKANEMAEDASVTDRAAKGRKSIDPLKKAGKVGKKAFNFLEGLLKILKVYLLKWIIGPLMTAFSFIAKPIRALFGFFGKFAKLLPGARLLGRLFWPITIIMGAFESISAIADVVKEGGLTLKNLPNIIKAGIGGLIGGLVGGFLEAIKWVVARVLDFFGLDAIASLLDSINMVDAVKEAYNKVWDAYFGGIAAIGDKIREGFSFVQSFFSGIWTNIKGFAAEKWEAIKSGFAAAFDIFMFIPRMLGKLWTSFIEKVKSLPFVGDMIAGAVGAKEAVVNTVQEKAAETMNVNKGTQGKLSQLASQGVEVKPGKFGFGKPSLEPEALDAIGQSLTAAELKELAKSGEYSKQTNEILMQMANTKENKASKVQVQTEAATTPKVDVAAPILPETPVLDEPKFDPNQFQGMAKSADALAEALVGDRVAVAPVTPVVSSPTIDNKVTTNTMPAVNVGRAVSAPAPVNVNSPEIEAPAPIVTNVATDTPAAPNVTLESPNAPVVDDSGRVVSQPAPAATAPQDDRSVSEPQKRTDIYGRIEDVDRKIFKAKGVVKNVERRGHRLSRLPDNVKNRVGYSLDGIKNIGRRKSGRDLALGAAITGATAIAEKNRKIKEDQQTQQSKSTTNVVNAPSSNNVTNNIDTNKPYDTDRIFMQLQNTFKVS